MSYEAISEHLAEMYGLEGIVLSEDPKAMFEKYADKISELFKLRSSIKHMRGVDMSNSLELV
jgi:hypothetical protein